MSYIFKVIEVLSPETVVFSLLQTNAMAALTIEEGGVVHAKRYFTRSGKFHT